ncbi:helix-turn-helix domain-containing protein [Neobacillus terrae]|uniref:helix-turn-helix domain-containing protein n=1 Tax=Neobacillus terrae TaxID=3034837 RepID=UPI0014072462|nr:helix-turn-helix transcriptional regulator [Neobacillus terrae]NHM32406.1 helix-turn-helix transcriptional regulator [Neobacillus terrae]
MKTKIPRHNSIGLKIRQARKLRGFTLEELAEGICSLGKMSNIENGHTTASDEELKKFSQKLNFPVSYFADPDINEKIKELDYIKHKIADLIGLQHWKYIKEELKVFKNKLEAYQIPRMKVDYDFLSGIFYLRTEQYQIAQEFLTCVTETEDSSKYIARLKIKAYNALSSILFIQKKTSMAIEMLNTALEISKENPTVFKEEIDNIYYNLSILYLYIGSTYQSLNFINKVHQHTINNIGTDYIKLLIRYLEDDVPQNIKDSLLSLRHKFQETNDQEGILHGWALAVYTIAISQPNRTIRKELQEIFLTDIGRLSEIERFRGKALAIYQLGIYVLLSRFEEQAFVQKLFNETKRLLSKVTDPILLARNHYLEGRFHREFLKDTSSSLILFEKALEALDIHYEGLLKAEILYEISQIKDPMNSAKQSNEIYHIHLKRKILFTHFHELILPNFKY